MAAGVLIERAGYPLTVSLCCGVLVSIVVIGIRWRPLGAAYATKSSVP